MKVAAKLLALLTLVVLAFAVNAYASEYFAGLLFPRVVPRPYSEMISAAIVGALAATAVTVMPLIKLYAQRAWLAAVVVASPVVVLRASDLMHFQGMNEPRIIVMSWVELLVYPVSIVAAAWFFSSRRSSHSAA